MSAEGMAGGGGAGCGWVGVVDIGAHRARFGLGGDEWPCVQLPSTCVHGQQLQRHGGDNISCGHAALAGCDPGDLLLNPFADVVYAGPAEAAGAGGVDWRTWAALLQHGVSRLPAAVDTLVVVGRPWVAAYEERVLHAAFTALPDVDHVACIPAPTAACLAHGVESGIVIDCGDRVTTVTPVAGLQALRDACVRTPYAGSAMTADFAHAFAAKGVEVHPRYLLDKEHLPSGGVAVRVDTAADPSAHGFSKRAYWAADVCREAKETLAAVAPRAGEPAPGAAQARYTLPDGQVVVFGAERTQLAEAIFGEDAGRGAGLRWDPLGGVADVVPRPGNAAAAPPAMGIVDMMLASLDRVDAAARAVAAASVLPIGGVTSMPCFAERLQCDIHSLRPTAGPAARLLSHGRVLPLSDVERVHTAWRGASILAQWDSLHDIAVARDVFFDSAGTRSTTALP